MAEVIWRLGELEPELMSRWVEVRQVLAAVSLTRKVAAEADVGVPDAAEKLLASEQKVEGLNKRMAGVAEALARRTITAEERTKAQDLLAQAQEALAREDWKTARNLAREAMDKYPLPEAAEVVATAQDKALARALAQADELEGKKSFAEAASVLSDAYYFTGVPSLISRIEYLKRMAAAKEIVEAEKGRTVEEAIRLMRRALGKAFTRVLCAAPRHRRLASNCGAGRR